MWKVNIVVITDNAISYSPISNSDRSKVRQVHGAAREMEIRI